MIRRTVRLVAAPVGVIAVTILWAGGAFAQQVTELRPNLTPFAASDLLMVIDPSGTPTLRFSTISWNHGLGPMELVAGDVDSATNKQKVYQRVYLSDGGFYDRLAGTVDYHPEHQHFHFEDYALYTLQPVGSTGGSQRQSAKTSFCLLDNQKIDTSLAGAPKQATYTACSPVIQGISVGWGDRYGYSLPGQSFDLTGAADGDYDLTIEVDPKGSSQEGKLLESDEADNTSCVRLRISVSANTVQVLGACGSSSGVVSLSSITPSTVSSGSSVNVVIKGTGFVDGMSVGFENGSGPAPVASAVTVMDSNTIQATVRVKSGGPRRERVWDVRVSSAVLPRGFTVVP